MRTGDESALSGRFVASGVTLTVKRFNKFYVRWFVAFAALGLVAPLANWATRFRFDNIVGPIPAIAFVSPPFVFGALHVLRRWRFGRILVAVTDAGLTVSRWRGVVFAFSDVQVGQWRFANERFGGVAAGTALHLRSGDRRFVLGGRDHRLATDARLRASPVDGVDAWMWASDFHDLLTVIGNRGGLDVREPAPDEPTRCLLFRDRSSGDHDPKPSVAIDVSRDAYTVVNLETNGRVGAGPLAHMTATPAEWTWSAKITSTLPVLVLRASGGHRMSIGCPDGPGVHGPRFSFDPKAQYRFAWRGTVPKEKQPAYWVSAADWLTLTERLGLSSRLLDIARPDASAAF